MRLPRLNAWSRQPCRPGRQWLAATMLLLAAGTGAAAGYPDRPIRLIMGFPPGSTVDILARPVAQRLSEAFGQPVIVDNRSGATGIIANELVSLAPAASVPILNARLMA